MMLANFAAAAAVCLLSAGAGIAGVETDRPPLVVAALIGLIGSAAAILTLVALALLRAIQ